MASSNQEEINPFISYVDLFSAVILVLLLFVLIMFVNVGHYMKMNAKIDENQTVVSKEDAELLEKLKEGKENFELVEKREDVVPVPKVEEPPIVEEIVEQTPVAEEEVDGKSVQKTVKRYALADFVEADMSIVYKNNELFLTKDVAMDVVASLKRIKSSNPNVSFLLSVGDSKRIISLTQSKQASLGRILSLKNTIEANPDLKGRVKVNYKPMKNQQYEYGYIKIEVK